ncbi:MAG: EAL domain-containing protein [Alphaproteobacteria bacterium]|nr:EAL domain-containing protein [Alphaproteobacteria bacterium]
MSLAHLDGETVRQFAFAASDLLLSTDSSGYITEAAGESYLLHHPSSDRLIGKNALDLISEGETRRLREDMWALGPGRRVAWEDTSSVEGGRRIIIQRNRAAPDTFSFSVSRIPATTRIRGDRTEDLMAERFRDAVMNGHLHAARQPVIDLRSGALSHFEMLARFDGEDSPASLIAAAEKSGQICHLDYIMVSAAAARLAADSNPAFRLAVNISGESIQRTEIVRELQAVISGHDFHPSRLIVEVTESAEILDLDAAAHSVGQFRTSGVGVSLDDFGSGAASFGYLRALEVDGLKFDGSLLKAGAGGSRGMALMRNVARMCTELGIASIGEMVETEAEKATLLDAGVRYAQGYLFGRPTIDPAFFDRRARLERTAA